MIGAGCFVDLIYHFLRYSTWQIGKVWLAIAVVSALVSFAVYSQRWARNEQRFNLRAQQVLQADAAAQRELI
jgi:hypothetical protein